MHASVEHFVLTQDALYSRRVYSKQTLISSPLLTPQVYGLTPSVRSRFSLKRGCGAGSAGRQGLQLCTREEFWELCTREEFFQNVLSKKRFIHDHSPRPWVNVLTSRLDMTDLIIRAGTRGTGAFRNHLHIQTERFPPPLHLPPTSHEISDDSIFRLDTTDLIIRAGTRGTGARRSTTLSTSTAKPVRPCVTYLGVIGDEGSFRI